MYLDIQSAYNDINLRTATFNSRRYIFDEAGGRIRTPDRLITNQLLYQLSYASASFLTIAYLLKICLVILGDRGSGSGVRGQGSGEKLEMAGVLTRNSTLNSQLPTLNS
jgi:hypothetical protein